MIPPISPMFRRRAMTVALSVIGTVIFHVSGLPLPFLFGPMTACLVGALAGLRLAGMGIISTAARTILGVAIGASLTPEVAGQLPSMAASLLLVPIYIVAIAAIGVPFFRKVCGFDMVTSWYAAMPGGLQDMIIFGTEAGGDGRALSLIHATRILVIISLAPIILINGFGVQLSNPLGAPASTIPVTELALMVVAALVGWKGGQRIGLFGASILGPMIVTGALSLLGFIHARPPSEAILSAQFLIGLGIGVGYVGVTMAELRRDVAAGVAFVLLLAILAAVFAEIVVLLGLAPPVEGFLAFAPGGQAEMTILAIAVGADLGYVVVHHLARVFTVIIGAPIAIRLFHRGSRS